MRKARRSCVCVGFTAFCRVVVVDPVVVEVEEVDVRRELVWLLGGLLEGLLEGLHVGLDQGDGGDSARLVAGRAPGCTDSANSRT